MGCVGRVGQLLQVRPLLLDRLPDGGQQLLRLRPTTLYADRQLWQLGAILRGELKLDLHPLNRSTWKLEGGCQLNLPRVAERRKLQPPRRT